MRKIHFLIRYAWALPATAIGLLLSGLALSLGATIRRVDGVMEVAGGRVDRLASVLPSPRVVAITFGHVIIGVDHGILGEVRSHEHAHVRQYERWGIVFFPLYIASSLVQWLLGRDPYLDNCFERAARAESATDDERLPRRANVARARHANEEKIRA